MKAFHDTRDELYRTPFGAIAAGEEVALSLDVSDAPGSTAVVRTWFEGVGEEIYEMLPVAGEDCEGVEDDVVRFRATLKPNDAGILWYQFVITDTEGRPWRYGARNGRSGGVGQLVGWEPPSFQLTVYDPQAEPPVWHEPVNGYLHDEVPGRGLADVVATMLENYPFALCETASPWPADEEAARTLPDELPTMEQALAEAQAKTADSAWFALNDDLFGFWRKSEAGFMCCALFNASPRTAYDVPVPMVDAEVADVLGGYGVAVVGDDAAGELLPLVPNLGRYALVHMWPFGSAILHFHGHSRLARPMEPGLGVLAHITSLPKDDGGRGTLGAPAKAFVDWLAEAGVKYWQVLPVNPTDECGSPYAGISAFAGNTLLLEGGAEAAETPDEDAYREFCERQANWLEPYAAFMAIRGKVGEGVAWQKWPKKYRRYDAKAIEADAGLKAGAEACKRAQFAFECQWKELRSYANERGVLVIGDIPLYVSADSADVWAHPELFQLGPDGTPGLVAGCPPDAFAPDGQIWGNPVYDWQAVRADGYAWWLRRLRRVFDLYDYVRLDHFIGFSRYYAIPVGQKASAGTFHLGPGYDLLDRARREFGPLPIIAEDLGLITPRVRSLLADCGFAGMDILQFADGNDPLAGYAPRPEKVVYTGTHDNQTLVGYIHDRYPLTDEREAADKLVGMVVGCDAPVRILPLQDVLRLGDEARMNVPGVAEGNWGWQADAADVEAALGYLQGLARR